MAPLSLKPEQADLLAARLADEAKGHAESHSMDIPEDEAAAFLSLYETLTPMANLIRELRETRQTTAIERMREIAKECIDTMQHSVGYEYVCLLRARDGDPEYLDGYGSKEAAEQAFEKAVEADAREARVAREVFEAIRDAA